MDQLKNQENKETEVITFKTKEKVTVKVHGKPNLDILARKFIDLYNQKLNNSAS
jgi:hypothetical protein